MKGYGFMKENQNQPLRKGLITILSVILIIFFSFYVYKWIEVKKESKYLNSYLIETNTINLEMTDIDEISSVLSETPSYYFIYIGYTKDQNTYEFEKKLKPLIDNYALQNNFYYLNITDIKENNKNYKEQLNQKLNLEKNTISKVPVILYFKDNELVKKDIYNTKDFENLLKTLEIKPS